MHVTCLKHVQSKNKAKETNKNTNKKSKAKQNARYCVPIWLPLGLVINNSSSTHLVWLQRIQSYTD